MAGRKMFENGQWVKWRPHSEETIKKMRRAALARKKKAKQKKDSK
jgi:hypothetical protein